jgi:DNA polymerase (family 10)
MLPFADAVPASNGTRATIRLNENYIQVDLRLVLNHEFGPAMLYLGGSKEHKVSLRTWAKTKGLTLNEYGLFNAESGKRPAGETEEEIYQLLGLQFIPPELREDTGEIEKSYKHDLPELVKDNEIRGDLLVHSSWCDAANDIETIARHVIATYPRYEYIVISDHSLGEGPAKGLQPKDFIR